MKNLLKTLLLISIFATALSSCRKSLEDKYKQDIKNETAKTTAAIKASGNFKWNTTTSMTINFKSMPADERIAIFKIEATDGSMILQKLQKASEDFTVLIEIPVHYDKLSVSFGGTTKEFETKNGKIDMDLN